MTIMFGGDGAKSMTIAPNVGQIGNFFYARTASTLANPIYAVGDPRMSALGDDYRYSTGQILYEWRNPNPLLYTLVVRKIGTDQHDNTYYQWIFDDVESTQISGSACIGTIYEPFEFPTPIRVRNNIKLVIYNNNRVVTEVDHDNNPDTAKEDVTVYVPYPHNPTSIPIHPFPTDPANWVPYEVVIVGEIES